MNENVSAILLAAGCGSRISEVTQRPKCLLEVAGRSLLEWHLQRFSQLNIRKVYVVVGYEAHQIRTHLQQFEPEFDLKYIENPNFRELGNGYSLLLGLQQAQGGVLVCDADLALEPDILEDFLLDARQNQVLVGTGSIEDIECAKTLVDSGNRVKKLIDKRALTEQEVELYDFAGEAIGILKFSDQGRKELLESAENFFTQKANLQLNWEHLMNVHFEKYEVTAYRTCSERWIEIDTPGDLARARALFEPGLEAVT